VHNRILVAEDLESNQELIRIYLRAGGYQAAFVANGAEAVTAVQSDTYDLVLMDIQMAPMDGIAAAKAIRKLAGPVRDLPIIAMTANVLPEQIRCIEAAGINGYVAKPTELADLLREIRRFVEPRKLSAHSEKKAPAEVAGFVLEDFEAFRTISGEQTVAVWLTRLSKELQRTFFDEEADKFDPSLLARRAHAIVSQAGLLGFSDLTQLCGTLEQTCANGGDVSSAFGKAERSARAVRDAIGTLESRP
jgi:CheY-like chemotaxis protein